MAQIARVLVSTSCLSCFAGVAGGHKTGRIVCLLSTQCNPHPDIEGRRTWYGVVETGMLIILQLYTPVTSFDSLVHQILITSMIAIDDSLFSLLKRRGILFLLPDA